MITFPNAKINIGLRVVEKRTDGFHNIETVFYPAGLCDALEIVSAPDFAFHISGNACDTSSENNTVVKAYQLLKNEFDLPPVHIHLHKQIPTGAGLGGGSADGAFTLKILNALFKLGLTNSILEKFAAFLGADCPFFIRNAPSIATGKGEILSRIGNILSGFGILIVKPPFSINTGDAYRNIKPSLPVHPLKEIIRLPVNQWKDLLKNDFEMYVAAKFPEISEIKEQLYNMGALYACMTGSGSSVFGIFRSSPIKPDSSFPESYFIYR